jgi:signal transduction histidine kinase
MRPADPDRLPVPPPQWRTPLLSRRLPVGAQAGLLFVVYVLLAEASYRIALLPEGVGVWWLPQGVAVAAIVSSPRRKWPPLLAAIYLAELSSVLLHGRSLPVAVVWSFANTAVPTVAGLLLRRWPGAPLTLDRVREVLLLGLVGGLIAPAVGGLIVAPLALIEAGDGSFWVIWTGWALSDTLGVLTITPLLLTERGPRSWPRGASAIEAVTLLATVAVLSHLIFAMDPGRMYVLPLPYLLFPFGVWAALRFGSHGAALVSLIVVVFAVAHTVDGLGPFSIRELSTRQRVWSVQAYLMVLSLSSLSLSAAMAERRASERRQALLVEVGEMFAASLDPDATFGKLSRLLVATFADGSAVLLRSNEEQVPVAVAHVDPGEEERLWGLLRTPAVERAVRETSVVELSGRVLKLALVARGKELGSLLLVRSEDAPSFAPSERTLADDLARRTAQALETMNLFRERGEAIAARDEFLSVAAHELRTPLTTLKLQAQVLAPLLQGLDPAVAQKGHRLERQIARLNRLVERLLDVGRISTGHLELELEPLDLAELAETVVSAMREELERAGCEVRLRTEPAHGSWDRLRIEQVLTNLLSNAIKFGRGRPIDVTVAPAGERARLTVRDHGMGIVPEAQRRIFERFERAVSSAAYGGLGLGLYLSTQFAQAHRGTLTVQSEPGQGATFVLELPALPAQRSATPEASELAPSP